MAYLLLLASLVAVVPGMTAETRTATVTWQGVIEFPKGKVENAMDSSLRRPGTAGGATMPAIFLHPQNDGQATLTFPPVSGGLEGGLREFFVGYAGISDGFKWDDAEHEPDGVGFHVSWNGKEVAATYLKESKWVPIAAQLYEAPAGGGTLDGTPTLATDCGPNHNASYDWAMFGEPMLVTVDGRPLPASAAVSGANGVFLADVAGGAGKVLVEGVNAQGQPIEEAAAALSVAEEDKGLRFIRFDFTANADCRQWRWRAEGVDVTAAWGGSLQPTLSLVECGPVQAVTVAGEHLRVRAGLRNDGPGALMPEHGAVVRCNGQEHPIERMAPDARGSVDFDLGIPDAGLTKVEALALVGGHAHTITTGVVVWPSLPKLSEERPKKAEARELTRDYVLLENPEVRWLVCKAADGLEALVYAWVDGRWELTGSVAPWLTLVPTASGGYRSPDLPLVETRRVADGVQLTAKTDGGQLDCTIAATLPDKGAALRVETIVEAREPVSLAAVWGPAVHAGDRNTRADKGIAIFPGLEYLEGQEASSSERDFAPPLNQRWSPHKFKVTVPFMMVETRDHGPVMAVAWDPRQKWDGEHSEPGACFASPDFLDFQDNHLMQLLLPSIPDSIPESQRRASEPLPLQPGKPWRLVQQIVAARPEPDATGALKWVEQLVGYPAPEAWARGFEEEMALCRHGFLETVWDPATQKGRHVVGWAPANVPGFATLMLMDARAVARGEAKTQLLERVKLIADQTVKQDGPGGLASGANCHTLAGEFPYHWGYVPAALEPIKGGAYGALRSQEEDGGWGFYPDESRRKLGEPGTRVVGICASRVLAMAKWVAISGDPVVEAGLRKALAHLERYRVPRGAQGWECPIMEPDVLASAYALRAYTWSYMALGDAKLLDRARFWARTGLPFQYSWDDGQHPGMRYASIPVFGSTFFTHSWLGLPVQWCGLVYAYGLQELLRFGPDELLRKQVEGMTVSATYQQWPMDNKELAGTYPDSFGQWFTHRNPVFINPENIELNLLALKGLDPGLRSAAATFDGGPVHVTAPADLEVKTTERELRVGLKYVPGETCYATIAPVAVSEGTKVTVGGEVLPLRETLGAGTLGWAYDAGMRVLAVGLKADAQGKAQLVLSGLRRSVPEVPKTVTSWEFEKDAEGWAAEHSCRLKAEDGHLVVTVTGDDPYAVSGPTDIQANAQKHLKARVRVSGGQEVALFWRSARSPQWGPDKEVHLPVPADGQWHEVTWDLAAHPLWSGVIEQIRLDVEGAGSTTPGVTLDVDWIWPE